MKTALVTGSTRGIGAAIANKLSEHGYQVFTNGRSGGDVPADLSSVEGVIALADAVIARTDRLDCLVLNAGTTCRTPFPEISLDEWQSVMNVNVTLPAFLVQKLFHHLADGGSIVFIASAMALHPHAASLVYGVSKMAVAALARNLVKELAPRGIRVNAVCPGFVDTEWQIEKPEWLRKKIENKIALGRFAAPSEIADLVLSIVNNPYMNGSVVNIDGGYDFV